MRFPRRSQPLIPDFAVAFAFGLLILGAGIACIVGSYAGGERLRHLQGLERSTAEVVDRDVDEWGRRHCFGAMVSPTLEFHVGDTAYDVANGVEECGREKYQLGDRVPILYDPDDPSDSWANPDGLATTSARQERWMWIVGIPLLVVGAFLVRAGVRGARARR